MTADDQLKGWKEIARYLGVEVRTAQRYVRRGLPLRRNDHVRGGVYAVKAELQKWRDGLNPHGGTGTPPCAAVHALLVLPSPLPAGRYVVSVTVTEHEESSDARRPDIRCRPLSLSTATSRVERSGSASEPNNC